MATHKKIVAEDAENLAVRSFSYIVADEGRMSRFLDVTGLRAETIREAAASPGFYAAVMDYVAADESLLLDLAQSLEVGPETLMDARRRLAPPVSE
jgi:hypothetical protein